MISRSLTSFCTAAALATMATAPLSNAATIAPIEGFDPGTYFVDNFLAGLDFNDGTSSNYPTAADALAPGFLDVPASNSKTYDLEQNGVTFDIDVTNANFGNQNRQRNNANAGALLTDFEQWFGDGPVEATIVYGGLTPGAEYEISLFTYNVGAGLTTHTYYSGSSSATGTLLGTIQTAGNQNNYATWEPGVVITDTADGSGEIAVTIVAVDDNARRLTFAGTSIVPEPSSLALLGLGGLLIARRRRA